ncbi:MAG: hypothetical protein M3R25_04925 [Bacteroidota bacterium]|nr:hypothetical protein [Bacteroidota bacterium]
MMARQITNILILITVLGISSCYYDDEETLYPPKECLTIGMSYQTNIAPILQRNCYVCHSAAANTANITLEGHASLLQYVSNGQLLGAINHASGFSPMPQNAPKLIACDIAKIEQWVKDGAPEN